MDSQYGQPQSHNLWTSLFYIRLEATSDVIYIVADVRLSSNTEILDHNRDCVTLFDSMSTGPMLWHFYAVFYFNLQFVGITSDADEVVKFIEH